MSAARRIDVVIVSWNTSALLRACLTSVCADPLVDHIVVVDNGSHDDSVAMVRAEFPQVVCLAESMNHGFAGGNNVGLRWLLAHGDAPYICCLNPDTIVRSGAFAVLVAYLDAHAEVVINGPRLVYADGSWQSSRRRFPTLGTYIWESTPLGRWWPHNPWTQRFQLADVAPDSDCRVDWLVGAALMVRRSAIEQYGLFDAEFALYSEEVEWQRRLTAGQTGAVAYCAAAEIVHYEGQSSQQMPTQRLIWFYQSRLREATAAHGWFTAMVVRVALLMMYALELCIEATKWTVGHKRPLRQQRMQAYGAVWRAMWQWRWRPARIW